MTATTAAEIAAFNALTQATFRHDPRNPVIRDSSPSTRWFAGDDKTVRLEIGCDEFPTNTTRSLVWRQKESDQAYMHFTVEAGSNNSGLTLQLTPDELRRLAARLIDAAADIELWPADRLAAYDSLCDTVTA